MEKKKLLLVSISVGVFFTIVLSACILVFAPKNPAGNAGENHSIGRDRAKGTTASPSRPIIAGTGASAAHGNENTLPATLDANELVRNAHGMQAIQTPPSATAIQETNFYINGARPADTYQIESKDGEAAARVTINIPRPSTAAVPDTVYDNRSNPRAAVQTAASPAPVKAEPKTNVKPIQSTKPAVQAKPPVQTKTFTDYWVQTGAFSAKHNAENVKQTLASKGISSIIENREIDIKTWYQVRVGPYTSENEAKYWLTLVQAIDGFAGSQIRQTRSAR
jgi:DedD protein